MEGKGRGSSEVGGSVQFERETQGGELGRPGASWDLERLERGGKSDEDGVHGVRC